MICLHPDQRWYCVEGSLQENAEIQAERMWALASVAMLPCMELKPVVRVNRVL